MFERSNPGICIRLQPSRPLVLNGDEPLADGVLPVQRSLKSKSPLTKRPLELTRRSPT